VSTTAMVFGTRARVRLAAVTGVATIGLDLALCFDHTTDLPTRAVPALVASFVLLVLSGGKREVLGLRLCPKQGWRYWVLPSAIGGGVIVLASAIYLLAFPSEWSSLAFSGQLLRDEVWDRILFSCFETPLVEEALYRLILCVSLLSIIGRLPTILVSGLVFASLHVIYHKPSPDNAIAGFVLGWAFLESESIALPIVMHGVGNLAVIGVELLAAAIAR